MKEKLIIKNFGPIKNVELELGRFNVLIGEQGTGKSALAKLLYVITNTSFLTGNAAEQKNIIDTYGLFFKKSTSIEYLTSEFQVKYSSGKASVTFSEEIQKDVDKELSSIKKSLSKENFSILKNFHYFTSLIQKEFKGYFYVPAERIALLATLRFMLNTSNRGIFKKNFDQYILDFASSYEIASEKVSEYSIPHLKNVSFERVNGLDKIKFKTDKLFLYQASSGFQASIPMVVFFEYFNSPRLGKNKFIIEEPELNLFPTAQYDLIKFFAQKNNQSKNSILLNTHSPYVLTSFNNLMHAFQVGQKNRVKVNKVIDKKYWINPNEVSAYQLLTDGTCESILGEDGLIMAERIDSVSNIINSEFDSITAIKYTHAE